MMKRCFMLFLRHITTMSMYNIYYTYALYIISILNF